MTYLLHASIYELPLQPVPDAAAMERWQSVGMEETSVSIITEAQTLSGLYFRGGERHFHYYQNILRGRIEVLGIDESVARLYARLRARCQRDGIGIADPDLMVAATALRHGLTVATLGQDSFGASGLVPWEDWGGPAANRRPPVQVACGVPATRRTM